MVQSKKPMHESRCLNWVCMARHSYFQWIPLQFFSSMKPHLFAAAIENVLVYQPVYDEHQSDLTTRWGKMISTTNYTVDAQVFLVLTGVSEE
jgi:hypothetical protein